jgi:hypothetical protein
MDWFKPDLTLEQRLELERFRRELAACNDLENLRKMSLQLLELSMARQNVIKGLMKSDCQTTIG